MSEVQGSLPLAGVWGWSPLPGNERSEAQLRQQVKLEAEPEASLETLGALALALGFDS